MNQIAECSSYEVTVTAHVKVRRIKVTLVLFVCLAVGENSVDTVLNLLRTL